MISKRLDENTVSFIAEETDDLLTIRRLLKKGDKIVGETTRVTVSYTHLRAHET